MSSLVAFMSAEMVAISSMASSVNCRSMLSTASSLPYWVVMALLRLGEDLDEILFGEALQLHVDGEAPLQFGDEVFHLGDVEGAGGDEEDEVRLHGAVLGHDGAALDDGQDVALDALAGDVRPALVGFAGDLVDLVDEDDALLLGAGERLRR